MWFGSLWVCGPASTIWAIWNQKNTNGPNFLEAHQNLQGRISLCKTTCSDTSSSPSWTYCQHNSDGMKVEGIVPPTKMISYIVLWSVEDIMGERVRRRLGYRYRITLYTFSLFRSGIRVSRWPHDHGGWRCQGSKCVTRPSLDASSHHNPSTMSFIIM